MGCWDFSLGRRQKKKREMGDRPKASAASVPTLLSERLSDVIEFVSKTRQGMLGFTGRFSVGS
jgi:hypothetical protein